MDNTISSDTNNADGSSASDSLPAKDDPNIADDGIDTASGDASADSLNADNEPKLPKSRYDKVNARYREAQAKLHEAQARLKEYEVIDTLFEQNPDLSEEFKSMLERKFKTKTDKSDKSDKSKPGLLEQEVNQLKSQLKEIRAKDAISNYSQFYDGAVKDIPEDFQELYRDYYEDAVLKMLKHHNMDVDQYDQRIAKAALNGAKKYLDTRLKKVVDRQQTSTPQKVPPTVKNPNVPIKKVNMANPSERLAYMTQLYKSAR